MSELSCALSSTGIFFAGNSSVFLFFKETVYDCGTGRGKSGASIAHSNHPNEYDCRHECDDNDDCIAYDYTLNSQNDACRLYDINEPRDGSGTDNREYCVENVDTNSNQFISLIVQNP